MELSNSPLRTARSLRIQLFVSDFSATGVVRNTVAIANNAAAAGYDVRILTLTADGVMGDQVDPRVSIVELLHDRKEASRRTKLKQAFFAYRRHSRDWQPDILFSAGNHSHLLSTFAWLGLPGSKLLRISNALDHGSTNPAARIWRKLKFLLVTSLADRLVLVSRAHNDHPLLSRLVENGKATVIPNGVDVEAVRTASLEPCPHPWAKDASVPIVLAVGRHVRQKNHATLLAAFAKAKRQQSMRLIILGDGDRAESERLHDLAATLGIAPDVDFVPTTPRPFPYMAAASVVALPSYWEGSSNVLLEAMACGTPVVAARTAGDAEYILDQGRYGILVEAQNEDELAEALVRQVSHLRVEPKDRASQFDRNTAISSYLRLFERSAH